MPTPEPPQPPRRPACTLCKVRKVKCDRDSPCMNCVKVCGDCDRSKDSVPHLIFIWCLVGCRLYPAHQRKNPRPKETHYRATTKTRSLRKDDSAIISYKKISRSHRHKALRQWRSKRRNPAPGCFPWQARDRRGVRPVHRQHALGGYI